MSANQATAHRKAMDNEALVTEVQRRLNDRGHKLEPDGWGGKLTTRALWQAWEELPPVETKILDDGAPPEIEIDQSLKLPAGQYMDAEVRKDLIVLHHTSGASGHSTYNWWASNRQRIGTAYIVERDGLVREIFDPSAWAYHLGIKGTGGSLDRRSIGIEIACEGALIPGSTFLDPTPSFYAFGAISPRTVYKGEIYDHGEPWRGYQYFAQYTPAAISATARLVRHLYWKYPDIPRRTPADHLGYDARRIGGDFRGVTAHHQLRPDKSDLHPGFPWAAFCVLAGLELAH